jgi:hypothetical protein
MADHAARNMPDPRAALPQPASPRGMARPALARTASGLNAQPRVIALKALGARLSGQAPGGVIQREAAAAPNRTGLPDQLKQGVEALSGMAMDDVRVHRNSARPAQLQAHAFAQGSDIHLAPGQEQHLPHEAWHVVQQKQGRVRATAQLKAGVALNDDRGLEREADVMGARALGTAPAQGPLVQAAGLSGNAPVQCQLWKWVRPMMGKPYWEQVGNNSNIPAPTHEGAFEGQLYDDQGYSQDTDDTVTPFLSSGYSFMGERALDKQLLGKTPTSGDIRVNAVKSDGLRGGSGLHEVVPTNLGSKVAKSGNESLIGAQSGFRTSTGKQMFNIEGDEVGVHTGFAPKLTGRGSTHTKGQSKAHDEMRDVVDDIMEDEVDDRDEVINALLLRHLEVTPHGQNILNSDYLTGSYPNDHHNLGMFGPINPKGTIDPQRLNQAQQRHDEREKVKRRGRTHKRATGNQRARSPSPPRTPIDPFGKGGGYIQKPTLQDEVEAFPFDPEIGEDYEYSANVTSWMSQPQRFK